MLKESSIIDLKAPRDGKMDFEAGYKSVGRQTCRKMGRRYNKEEAIYQQHFCDD